jgi:hypothetical protein
VRYDVFRQSKARPRFSISKFLSGVAQGGAFVTLLVVVWKMMTGAAVAQATLWALIAIFAQVMALTFFVMEREEQKAGRTRD